MAETTPLPISYQDELRAKEATEDTLRILKYTAITTPAGYVAINKLNQLDTVQQAWMEGITSLISAITVGNMRLNEPIRQEYLNATSLATPDTLVRRDPQADFASRFITAQRIYFSDGSYLSTANGLATSEHTHPFSNITATPTTLAGYGITDAVNSGMAIFTGTCSVGDVIGDIVVISAANKTVKRITQSDMATKPAVGVITSKPTTTSAIVQTIGQVGVFTGLTPGATYFVGANGRPSASPPSGTSPIYTQVIGVALDTTTLLLSNNFNVIES